MIDQVKQALRITGNDFNFEIAELIEAAKADLRSIGVSDDDSKPLVAMAIKMYCRMNFGQPDDYDRMKRAYDELKGQLQLSTAHRTEA